MPPEESKSSAANAAEAACRQPAIFNVKILHRQILRRGWILIALLAGLALCTAAATAQEERPEITPGERKAAKKKESGPRAVALLQMGANGKVSLVPIAILIGGKFWDATAYKADPVPMALDPGTVYEAERGGSSLGLFTVNNALHSRAVNSQAPWIATGKWVPGGSEPAKTELKAETTPVGIDKSDEPPRLTRNPQTPTPASPPTPTTAPPASAPQTTGASGSGDEPPRLTKGASTPPPPTGPSGPAAQGESKPGDSKNGDSKTADSKSSDSKPADAKADNHANLPASDSGATEENRPRLRRGKPVEPLPDDDVPGYSKPGAAPSAASSASPATDAAKTALAKVDTGPVDLVPAISDATGPQPRSFGYEWLKDEEGERRGQMVALAKQKVRSYVEALAKATITPAPTPAASAGARHTASTKAAAKTKDPILDNVKMTTYDVWTTNQPIMVFSAQAHMPPPPAGSPHSDVDSEMQYSLLLVAYPDTYNNLHTIYVGVTDKYHLDLTPRLELIDAVDADGDGRGELLFREVTDGGNGWAIYRPTADKLWKMFDSLHPE